MDNDYAWKTKALLQVNYVLVAFHQGQYSEANEIINGVYFDTLKGVAIPDEQSIELIEIVLAAKYACSCMLVLEEQGKFEHFGLGIFETAESFIENHCASGGDENRTIQIVSLWEERVRPIYQEFVEGLSNSVSIEQPISTQREILARLVQAVGEVFADVLTELSCLALVLRAFFLVYIGRQQDAANIFNMAVSIEKRMEDSGIEEPSEINVERISRFVSMQSLYR